MIHGSWVSIGCIAIGDSNIEEVYALAEDTGMKKWQVLISPSSSFLSGSLSYRREEEPSWYGELLASIADVIKREALVEPNRSEIRRMEQVPGLFVLELQRYSNSLTLSTPSTYPQI